MEDWDADLDDAIFKARRAAAKPLTRAMLDLCSCDMELPFSGSPKAMARLLDISILTGDQKAAVKLAKKCQVRPLRRWAVSFRGRRWKAARTALWAGADFQDLMVKDFGESDEDIPFPPALFLKSELEDWQEIRHLLPGCRDVWRPRNLDKNLAFFFLERPHWPGGGKKLSLGKIRAAEDAGLDLQCLFVAVWCFNHDGTLAFGKSAYLTFLDLAILFGQPDCAEACVDGGIELKDDERTLGLHKRVLREESLRLHFPDFPSIDVVPSEAQIAAAAAGRAWLKRSWKSESTQKGIVLYQMMLKMFKGRSFPTALVQEILTFSMPVPKIIDQLDLGEHVGDWMASVCCRPFAAAAADVDGTDVKIEFARVEGPCASNGLQPCTTTCTVGSWTGCDFFVIRNSCRKTTPI